MGEDAEKIWRLSDEAEQDIPTTVPHVQTPWEMFEHMIQVMKDE